MAQVESFLVLSCQLVGCVLLCSLRLDPTPNVISGGRSFSHRCQSHGCDVISLSRWCHAGGKAELVRSTRSLECPNLFLNWLTRCKKVTDFHMNLGPLAQLWCEDEVG